MKYEVSWDSKALDDLKKLDKAVAKKIINKVTSYLAVDPIGLGKPLSAKFKGLMRYRFGDYRIIYELYQTKCTIIIVKIGHRSSVYDA